MKILHRSLIVSRIIFKNIDPVILIGLGIGLFCGLGLAIGGNPQFTYHGQLPILPSTLIDWYAG